jgi:thiamine-phosphate pyrophosphorylase
LRRVPAAPFLYAVLDASLRGGRSWTEWVELVAGEDRARVVQLRAKELTDATFVEAAREVRAACARAAVTFIVNDRPDIARIVEADGVHVGQDDLPPDEVRRLLPDALIGVSTHADPQLEAALATTADYVAVGPVFPTGSKQNPDPVVGLDFVRRAAARAGSRPLVAIGGITTVTASRTVAAGASGIAVIAPLMRAPDPGEAARELVRSLRSA